MNKTDISDSSVNKGSNSTTRNTAPDTNVAAPSTSIGITNTASDKPIRTDIAKDTKIPQGHSATDALEVLPVLSSHSDPTASILASSANTAHRIAVLQALSAPVPSLNTADSTGIAPTGIPATIGTTKLAHEIAAAVVSSVVPSLGASRQSADSVATLPATPMVSTQTTGIGTAIAGKAINSSFTLNPHNNATVTRNDQQWILPRQEKKGLVPSGTNTLIAPPPQKRMRLTEEANLTDRGHGTTNPSHSSDQSVQHHSDMQPNVSSFRQKGSTGATFPGVPTNHTSTQSVQNHSEIQPTVSSFLQKGKSARSDIAGVPTSHTTTASVQNHSDLQPVVSSFIQKGGSAGSTVPVVSTSRSSTQSIQNHSDIQPIVSSLLQQGSTDKTVLGVPTSHTSTEGLQNHSDMHPVVSSLSQKGGSARSTTPGFLISNNNIIPHQHSPYTSLNKTNVVVPPLAQDNNKQESYKIKKPTKKIKKDPNAPKRAMNAYMLFSNAKRPEIRAANPDAKFGELGSMVGAQWKKLNDAERKFWDDKAAEEKKRYEEEMKKYSPPVAKELYDQTTESNSTANSTSPNEILGTLPESRCLAASNSGSEGGVFDDAENDTLIEALSQPSDGAPKTVPNFGMFDDSDEDIQQSRGNGITFRKKIANTEESFKAKKRTKTVVSSGKIIFSVKDHEFAVSIFKKVNDLSGVLPKKDCQFLADTFWIFSVQQLEYVLSHKPEQDEKDARGNSSSENWRQEIINALIASKSDLLATELESTLATEPAPNYGNYLSSDSADTTGEKRWVPITTVATKSGTEGQESKTNNTVANTDSTEATTRKDMHTTPGMGDVGGDSKAKTSLEISIKEERKNKDSAVTEPVIKANDKSSFESSGDKVVAPILTKNVHKNTKVEVCVNDAVGTEFIQAGPVREDIGNGATVEASLEVATHEENKSSDTAPTGQRAAQKGSPGVGLSDKSRKKATEAISIETNTAVVESKPEVTTDKEENECDKRKKQLAERKLEKWEKTVKEWRECKADEMVEIPATNGKGNARVPPNMEKQFPLDGPIQSLFPLPFRQFLISMNINSAFKFLATRKTELSPLVFAFRLWRAKCGLPDLKAAALGKHLVGLALRVEKALSSVPPADEFTKTWMGDILIVLTGSAKDFIVDEMRIKNGIQVIESKTKDLADGLALWRERKNLPPLKGSGKVAMISAWKTNLKEAIEAESGSGVIMSEKELIGDDSNLLGRPKVEKQKRPCKSSDEIEAEIQSSEFLASLLKPGDVEFLATQDICNADQLLAATSKSITTLAEALGKVNGANQDIQENPTVVIHNWTEKVRKKISETCSSAKKKKKKIAKLAPVEITTGEVDNRTSMSKKSIAEKKPFVPSSASDPIEALSSTILGFLDGMGIKTAESLMTTKTSVIADHFIEWRAGRNMSVLKGYGGIASVSGWKALVRKAAKEMGRKEIANLAPSDKNAKENTRANGQKLQSSRVMKPILNTTHPAILMGLSRLEFTVCNQMGMLYDFELSVRQPGMTNQPLKITFPPGLGVYLMYKGSRHSPNIFLKNKTLIPENIIQSNPKKFPILADANLFGGVKECNCFGDSTAENFAPFSSNSPGCGVIDLSCYGVQPFTDDRPGPVERLMEKISRFVNFDGERDGSEMSKGESNAKGTCINNGNIKDGVLKEMGKTDAALDDESDKPTSTCHANLFLKQTRGSDRRQCLLYLDQNIEKGQMVELMFYQKIQYETLFDHSQSNDNPGEEELDLRLDIQKKISTLSIKDLHLVIAFLRTLGDPIISNVSSILNNEIADSCTHQPYNPTLFISRRRLHWVASIAEKQLTNLEDASGLKYSTNPQGHLLEDRRSILTKLSVGKTLGVAVQGSSELFSALQAEIAQEIKVEMDFRGAVKRPHDRSTWCKMTQELLANSSNLLSLYELKRDLDPDHESPITAIDSLVSAAIKSLFARDDTFDMLNFHLNGSDLNDVARQRQTVALQSYQDAMELCHDIPFADQNFEDVCSSLLPRNSSVVATRAAWRKEDSHTSEDKEETPVMRTDYDVRNENAPLHIEWYVRQQILPVIHGMKCWCLERWKMLHDESIGSVCHIFSGDRMEKVINETILDINKNSPNIVISTGSYYGGSVERVRIEALELPDTLKPKPLPYGPTTLQLFLGIVWPTLRSEYGWHIDAGDDPTDVLYVSPKEKSRIRKHPGLVEEGQVRTARAKKKAKLVEKVNDLGLGHMRDEMKDVFVKILEDDLNKDEYMSCSDDDESSSMPTGVSCTTTCTRARSTTEDVLDSFSKHVISQLPDDQRKGTNNRIQIIIDGIITCFGELLPDLTYPFENEYDDCQQPFEMKNNVHKYGCDFLLRLLTVLPRLLREVDIPKKELNNTITVIREMTQYLTTNNSDFFDEAVQPTVQPPQSSENADLTSAIALELTKLRKLEEDGDEDDKSINNNTAIEEVNVEDNEELLVHEEDKANMTDFFYLVMRQVLPYRANDEDVARKGRRGVRAGTPGLICRHCFGSDGEGKYFFNSVDSLGTALTVIHNHMNKCSKVSSSLRERSNTYKARHSKQRNNLSRGSQSAFFLRIWRVLSSCKGSSIVQNSTKDTNMEEDGPEQEEEEKEINDNDENSNSKTFRSHVSLMSYLVNNNNNQKHSNRRDGTCTTSGGSSSDDNLLLHKCCQKYYQIIQHGSSIYNTSVMPPHFNSEWLLAKMTPHQVDKSTKDRYLAN